MRGSYPVRLFYTSNMPIMLQSALSSNIFLVSQMMYSRFSDNLLIKLLGVWEPREGSAQLYATSGIAYYMSPPLSKSPLLVPNHVSRVLKTLQTSLKLSLTPSTPRSTSPSCLSLAPSSQRPGSKSPARHPVTSPSSLRSKDSSWLDTESKVCTRS